MKTHMAILILLTAGTTLAQSENNERRQPPTAADFVKRLDMDGDDKVSESEFDGPAEHFSTFDNNSDGYISKDEAPAGPPPRLEQGQAQGPQSGQGESIAGFVAQFDKDGNGMVSSDEFDGPAGHFSQFDVNNDGYISESEAPAGPPPREQQGQEQVRRPQQGQGESTDGFVTRLDKDGDGKVSSDEFDGPAEHFSHLDTNGDGHLSKDEAPAGPPPEGRR